MLHATDMSTYSKIYIQVVFAVRGRQSLIMPSWEVLLHKYITGTVQRMEQKMIAINGTSNHIHFFIGMKPSCCLSDLVREVKKSSNKFINESRITPFPFRWQEGFGAFSYHERDISRIASYIQNQKEHHKKITFKDEYSSLLKEFDIGYEMPYFNQWFEHVVPEDHEGRI